MAPSLLTKQQHRRIISEQMREHRAARDCVDIRDLLRTAEAAARLVMTGHDADRRQECASAILIDAMQATEAKRRIPLDADALDAAPQLWSVQAVKRGDAMHSLEAYKNRARNFRARLEHRAAVHSMSEEAQRSAENVADPSAPLGVRVERESVPSCWRAADAAMRRLAMQSDGAWLIAYAAARGHALDNGGATNVAAELGISAAAAQQRVSRGRKAIHAAYPDPRHFLRTLVGGVSRGAGDWSTLDPSAPLTISTDDGPWPSEARRETDTARTKTPKSNAAQHALAGWREGTADGDRPTRPADGDQARAACDVSQVRDRNERRRAATRRRHFTDADRADSLRRLASAQARATGRAPAPRRDRTATEVAAKIVRKSR